MKDIRRRTRKQRSAREKTRIVPEGPRGAESIAGLCRRAGIATGLSCSRSGAPALEAAVANLTLEDRLPERA